MRVVLMRHDSGDQFGEINRHVSGYRLNLRFIVRVRLSVTENEPILDARD